MDALEEFRGEIRAWLEDNCPASMRTPMTSELDAVAGGRDAVFPNEDARIWLERFGGKGYTIPTWPKEYGGGGLTKGEAKILHEEMRAMNCRPALAFSFGINMLGPVLLEFANEEQKKEHIPKIARGEIRWCQGYSEPNAGSDLAGLQTRAELDGDHYTINGAKIWTSYANFADWIFCLVRTDFDAPKHEGISFILFDMASEGVTTKPIKLISGSSPFCQTFFDDVKVPAKNLVGQEGKGWTIAKRLLQHERSSIGGGGSLAGSATAGLDQFAKEYSGEENGRVKNAAVRRKVAQMQMDQQAFGITVKKSADEAKAGSPPGPASSIFKYYGTELNKRRYELLMSIHGTQGLGWEGDGFKQPELDMTRSWLRSKANSIEGGTSEVQLNIISKRVLELPTGSSD
ncbi:MAG: acyl-CoA dehydrogenase family protein [Pseudomonadota bacterium]